MKIFKYRDYKHYKKAQIDANIEKYHRAWINTGTVEQIKKYVKKADKILCHGVRNGAELKYFDEVYNPSHIVGTDISPTVNRIKDFEVYEVDFHDPIKYTDYFDIVYTNSFDHSYAPRKALETFNDQLTVGGYLVVELPIGVDNQSNEMDPLMIEKEEYLEMLQDINHKIIMDFRIEYNEYRESLVILSKKQ
jgi:SAM-dependent methyltransferase